MFVQSTVKEIPLLVFWVCLLTGIENKEGKEKHILFQGGKKYHFFPPRPFPRLKMKYGKSGNNHLCGGAFQKRALNKCLKCKCA